MKLLALLLSAVMLSACAPSRVPAPVESRQVGKSSSRASVAPAPEGFYRVKRGDTLIGIALDHGVSFRELMNWNNLTNANLIEVDQLLRVRAPGSSRTASAPPVSAPKPSAEARTVPPADRPVDRPVIASAPVTTAPATGASSAGSSSAVEGIVWGWPGNGQIMAQFAEPTNKGISLAGAEGDPVMAAGDGRVVYSGSGLRGYGNLVIVKHEADFLTAYAHNKSILVSEGQTVKRGQKIAELGKTDSDVPKLHFEVRKSGKPVDPLKFLPAR